jgi:hypothetical protein
MRGMETGKTRIRHQVFTEIARMAYEGGDLARTLEELPYRIVPGEIATYSDSIFRGAGRGGRAAAPRPGHAARRAFRRIPSSPRA